MPDFILFFQIFWQVFKINFKYLFRRIWKRNQIFWQIFNFWSLIVGDELLEVNEQELRGKHIDEVYNVLLNMQGSLTFLVVPTRQHHMSPAHSYPGDPRAVSQNGTPTTTTPGRHGVIHLKVSHFLFLQRHQFKQLGPILAFLANFCA